MYRCGRMIKLGWANRSLKGSYDSHAQMSRAYVTSSQSLHVVIWYSSAACFIGDDIDLAQRIAPCLSLLAVVFLAGRYQHIRRGGLGDYVYEK